MKPSREAMRRFSRTVNVVYEIGGRGGVGVGGIAKGSRGTERWKDRPWG